MLLGLALAEDRKLFIGGLRQEVSCWFQAFSRFVLLTHLYVLGYETLTLTLSITSDTILETTHMLERMPLHCDALYCALGVKSISCPLDLPVGLVEVMDAFEGHRSLYSCGEVQPPSI